MNRHPRAGRLMAGGALLGLGALLVTAWPDFAQDAAQPQRAFAITATKYQFAPSKLEVDQNDLVKVTLTASDIAHSFTIDDYRIAKRAGAHQTVTFEFRADRPGTFRFYCNLKQDERCKEMQGELVVHAK
jgi:heme/copper-type cytochrome/quinol oxidase subunit 2